MSCEPEPRPHVRSLTQNTNSLPQTQDGRIHRIHQLMNEGERIQAIKKIDPTETTNLQQYDVEHSLGVMLYELIVNNGKDGTPIPITIRFECFPGEKLNPVSKNAFFAQIGEPNKIDTFSTKIKLHRIRMAGIIDDSVAAYSLLAANCPIIPIPQTNEAFLRRTFAELQKAQELQTTKPIGIDVRRKQALEAVELELLTERVMHFFPGINGDHQDFTDFAFEHDPDTNQPLAFFFRYSFGQLQDTHITATPFTTRNELALQPMKNSLGQMIRAEAVTS